MKIAVTYDNGLVFQHFGKSKQFKVFDVADGQVVSSHVLSLEEEVHCALGGWLKEQGVDTLICGGIGGGARTALAAEGISLYPGVSGEADQVVSDLLAGRLNFDPDTQCNHHEGEHHHHEGGCHHH